MAACNCTGACRNGGGCRGRPRGDDWWYEDDLPNIGGTGSLYDLNDRSAAPRLIHMKSVSKAGAWGLHKEPSRVQRPAGFISRKPGG